MLKHLFSLSFVVVAVGCAAGPGTAVDNDTGYTSTPNDSETPSAPATPRTGTTPGSGSTPGGSGGGSTAVCQSLCSEIAALPCIGGQGGSEYLQACIAQCGQLLSGECASILAPVLACASGQWSCVGDEVSVPESCAASVTPAQAEQCFGFGGGRCSPDDSCIGCSDACDACECQAELVPDIDCSSACGGGQTCSTSNQCSTCTDPCEQCNCYVDLGNTIDCTTLCGG